MINLPEKCCRTFSFQVVSGWGVNGCYGEDTRCSLKFDCGYLKFLRLYPDVFIVQNASFNKNGTSSPGAVTGMYGVINLISAQFKV
jgi:hypothetical protein